jgi:hypothetical protein
MFRCMMLESCEMTVCGDALLNAKAQLHHPINVGLGIPY